MAGPQSKPWRERVGPSRLVLMVLVWVVLLLHLALLSGLGSALSLQLRGEVSPDTLHMRMVTPAEPVGRAAPRPPSRPRAVQSAALAEAPMATAPAPAQAPTEVAVEPALETASAPTAQPAEVAPQEATPERVLPLGQDTPVGTAWPLIPLGALPPSRLLSYQLTGMDKGLTYHASGELRWQHNATDYELTLAVRAFLLGRRQWRSTGRIESTGLAPLRFSDSWRQERAAHFDRAQQRIVFSSNSHPAVLETGAQDQISLYVQLAAAMAGEPERFAPGTRLQVQTATVRDAQPWSLVLEGGDTMTVDGQNLKVSKWVCQPRNRFDARVEFWVAPEQAWLPLRIRITQASGSYIDLVWRSSEPLPPLPMLGDAKANNTGS